MSRRITLEGTANFGVPNVLNPVYGEVPRRGEMVEYIEISAYWRALDQAKGLREDRAIAADIEAAAKAIHGRLGGEQWPNVERHREHWEDLARAALGAVFSEVEA